MAISYYNESFGYAPNFFRIKKLPKGAILINDFGSWAYLGNEEFDSFFREKDKNMAVHKLLQDKGISLSLDSIDEFIANSRNALQNLFNGISNFKIMLNSESMDDEKLNKIAGIMLQSPSKDLRIKINSANLNNNFTSIKNLVYITKKNLEKSNKNARFNLLTNFEGMSSEIIDFIIKELMIVNTKFYPYEEIHNEFYSGAVSFNDYITALNKLVRKYYVHAFIDPAIIPHSEPKAVVDGFLNQNLKWININNHFASNTAKVNHENFLEFWREYLEYAISLHKREFSVTENSSLMILRRIFGVRHEFDFGYSPFGCLNKELVFDADGNIYPSEESVGIELFNLGDINMSYADITTSQQFIDYSKASINDISFIDVNPYKPYIEHCPVCSFIETGSIIPKHPYTYFKIQDGMIEHLFKEILFNENSRNVLTRWLNRRGD